MGTKSGKIYVETYYTDGVYQGEVSHGALPPRVFIVVGRPLDVEHGIQALVVAHSENLEGANHATDARIATLPKLAKLPRFAL